MIVSWSKNSNKGNISNDLVDFTDFLPSMMEAAGISEYSIPYKDGKSFIPSLKGVEGNKREWIFCEYDPKWGKHKKSRYVQTKQWKLYEDGSFYNFIKDTDEINPISIKELSSADLTEYKKLQDVLNNYK